MPIRTPGVDARLRKATCSAQSHWCQKEGGNKRVDTQEAFKNALERFAPNLILSDFSMPTFDGLLALSLAQAHVPDGFLIIFRFQT